MAEEIVQKVEIDFDGPQRLARDLRAAAAEAKRLNQEMGKDLRPNKDLDDFMAGNTGDPIGRDLREARAEAEKLRDATGAGMAGGFRQARAEAEKLRDATGSTALNAGRIAELMRNSMEVGKKLGDRMRDAWAADAAQKKQARDRENRTWFDEHLRRQAAEDSWRLRQEREKEQGERDRRERFLGRADMAGKVGLGMTMGLPRLANPFAAERFDQALKDLGAVVGRTLVPTMRKLTAGIRTAADTFNDLPGGVKDAAGGAIAGFGTYGMLRMMGMGPKYAGGLGLAVGLNEATDKGDGYGGTLEKGARGAKMFGQFLWRNTGGQFSMTQARRDEQSEMNGLIDRDSRGVATEAEKRRLREMQGRRGPGDFRGTPDKYGGIAPGGSSYGAAGLDASYTDAASFLSELRSSAFKTARMGGDPASQTAENTGRLVEIMSAMAARQGVDVRGTGTAAPAPPYNPWSVDSIPDRGTHGKGG